jgi:hypothetical protein
MTFKPYGGSDYLDWSGVEAFCRAVAAARPEWVALEEIGRSREGRSLLLLSLGAAGPDRDRRPAFWLDGGTHATEWTGVMSALYSVSRWVEGIDDGSLRDWFETHTVHVMPCLSPDGFQAMHEGLPALRSSLRPPRPGQPRSGLSPRDMDGDGVVRSMRWRHPAGPFVADDSEPLYLRPRRLDDDPASAWFLCPEGEFVNWDGVRWTAAPLEHGLDLNRNFPAWWEPYSMFGMDSGDFALSEPESRAAADAVRARPSIAAAITNHTYTGALLTQPYRLPSPLGKTDLQLMEELAADAVRGTGYRVLRVQPEFTYDPDRPIVGVWADTLSTVFGLPGYTLELWDPFGHAGVPLEKPAEFFVRPDPDTVRELVRCFGALPGAAEPWRPFEHPQLGAVEIGGLDPLRTVRNPPVELLAAECEKGHAVADRVRRALPAVEVRVETVDVGEGCWLLRAVAGNRGFLPTSGLERGREVGLAAPVVLRLEGSAGLEIVEGQAEQDLGFLDGWGSLRVGSSRHALYSTLPERGQQCGARWLVRGTGPATIEWSAGRGGAGSLAVHLPSAL